MALACVASVALGAVMRAPVMPRGAAMVGRQRIASLSMAANPTAKFKTSMGEFSAEVASARHTAGRAPPWTPPN
eukprot:6637474-Prymnesium_polylepis.1